MGKKAARRRRPPRSSVGQLILCERELLSERNARTEETSNTAVDCRRTEEEEDMSSRSLKGGVAGLLSLASLLVAFLAPVEGRISAGVRGNSAKLRLGRQLPSTSF